MNSGIGYEVMIWKIRIQQEDRTEIFSLFGCRHCRHLGILGSSVSPLINFCVLDIKSVSFVPGVMDCTSSLNFSLKHFWKSPSGRCCHFVPSILNMALYMYSNPFFFSFDPNAMVESKSLISSMVYTCAEDSWFTLYCVTDEQLPVGYCRS